MKTTISVIKADVGSLPGHVKVPEGMLEACKEDLEEGKGNVIKDYRVTNCGDDIDLIMTHNKGPNDDRVHELAWNAFQSAVKIAKERKYYGAGQDLLKEAFSGNVRGMGPGIAELEIEERPSEPIIVWACDKTSPSAFNLPIFKMFGDPFTNAGLIIDTKIHSGYKFEVHDIKEGRKITLQCPEELYDLLSLIGIANRYIIKKSSEPTVLPPPLLVPRN